MKALHGLLPWIACQNSPPVLEFRLHHTIGVSYCDP